MPIALGISDCGPSRAAYSRNPRRAGTSGTGRLMNAAALWPLTDAARQAPSPNRRCPRDRGCLNVFSDLGRPQRHRSRSPGRRRARGYFQNFQNVRAGQAAKAAADRGDHPSLAALSGYFARTHAAPDAARESFLALYREAPKLAVWAATNRPAAFGETNGAKPGRLDITILKELPASERPKPEAWTQEHQRAQRDEINDLKRATQKARAGRATDAAKRAVRASIELVARQAETAIRHDPTEAKDSVARLRALARDLVTMTSGAVPSPRGEQFGRTDNPSNTARGATDKTDRYNDLEDRLRQQDRATPKPRERDGGRDRDR